MADGSRVYVFVEGVVVGATRQRELHLSRLRIDSWHVENPGSEADPQRIGIAGPLIQPRRYPNSEADGFAVAADQLEELGWSGPALALLREAAAMSNSAT